MEGIRRKAAALYEWYKSPEVLEQVLLKRDHDEDLPRASSHQQSHQGQPYYKSIRIPVGVSDGDLAVQARLINTKYRCRRNRLIPMLFHTTTAL
jgi:hypothetical protein